MKVKSPDAAEFSANTINAAPLFSQLSIVFREMICSQKWPVGSSLPSEAELARRYGVSVGTTRKALEPLEEVGWITRRQGRGTYVSDPAGQQSEKFCPLFSKQSGNNLVLDCLVTTLTQDVTTLNEDEAVLLGLSETAKALRLERLFECEGKRLVIENLLLRADLFPGLQERKFIPVNIYSVFLRDYGIVVRRCTEVISAIAAHSRISELLNIPEADPILYSRGAFEDSEGKVAGLVQRWFRSSEVEYRSLLS